MKQVIGTVKSHFVPKRVPHSVLETDEVLIIFSHQVPCVEVSISFHKHIPHQLLLSQLLAPCIAKEWAGGTHLGQEKACVT